MIVLAASVLIGYLDAADGHHAAATTLMSRVVDEDLASSSITLAEVLVVPVRLGRLAQVLSILQDLDVRELPFPVDAAQQLAELRAQTGLKMPDCCVLLSAAATGSAVASFDDRLRFAAQRQGLAVVPVAG